MSMSVTISLIGLILVLVGNLGALIWGAAVLSTTVRNQGEQMDHMATTQRRTVNILSDLEARTRVLEAIHQLEE